MLLPDTILQNRYIIQGSIARGGYGAVYLAHDQRLAVNVALKETLQESDDFLRQFEHEAKLLASLTHPVLPHVSDYFTEHQKSYLVMNHIAGETLGDYIKRQETDGVSLDVALKLLLPILDALIYLHSQTPPVIHRDIKPANIRITPDERVYLVDFGIARVLEPGDDTTSAARAVTQGYSPLEQYGRGSHTDARSDLYAFGATLYYTLSRVPPPDAVNRARLDNLSPITDMNPLVPPACADILTKLLAVHADHRFQSASDVQLALAAFQAAAPVAIPTPATEPSPDKEPALLRPTAPPPADERLHIFGLRDRLIADYHAYVESFIRIQDTAIRRRVDAELAEGLLYPDPLIQLNPAFESGGLVDDLVTAGRLHPECRRIFRKGKGPDTPTGEPLQLHRHQVEAITLAQAGHNYVVTTGTGSGKSLTYIIPIVEHVVQRGTRRGIQAIVVYPMNALANSQAGELEKFLKHGYPQGEQPVTFASYTGQEHDETRQAILDHPPDILLTNYVMLELILTRPREQKLIAAAQGLRFLVFDELHTYRGRQGADVALLIRRVRDRLAADRLQCVGTSATLAGSGTYDEQRADVARVATQLFGTSVQPAHVVGETLRRITPERDLLDPVFIADLIGRMTDTHYQIPRDFAGFVRDPLSIWIESTFGVTRDPQSGRLVRSQPCSLTGEQGAAGRLHQLTGIAEADCVTILQQGLLASYECERNPDTGFPPFAFRLHQFISRGDTVFATIAPPEQRYSTVRGQRFRPGDRKQILLPLAFCRECGQEYYTVRLLQDERDQPRRAVPRDLTDQARDEPGEVGLLYISTTDPWPDDPDAQLERLPEDWLEEHRGARRVRRDRRQLLPQPVRLGADGVEHEQGVACSFLKGSFRFCLHCGVSYNPRQSSDFAKLATLGSEGRSTATTILSMAAVRGLQATDLPEQAHKLLSFTDNRQDASLQAGHFNDFIEIGLLRSALYRAVQDAGAAGVRHDELAQRVFDTLNLPLAAYADDPNVRFQARQDTERALREVLGYRLYRDLRRGWRVTSPNLEQCGLLDIQYLSLDEVCQAADLWQDCHAALVTATPETRATIARVLLDYMRRELAIKVDYLDARYQERVQQQSSQYLKDPWALDENETLEHAAMLYPRSAGERGQDYGGNIYLSGYSGFGQYLRRSSTFPDYAARVSRDETDEIIRQLLAALKTGGLVQVVDDGTSQRGTRRTRRNTPAGDAGQSEPVPGYQLPASVLRWVAGDGTRAFRDPIRVPNEPEQGKRTNPFFVDFYQRTAATLLGMEAREHTAQVPYDQRLKREERFREADLPILYCSPTMELGVDIAQLNAVNLRNIPPTPANYAQRSGRAGRSGQPALVFSYCSTGSSHDQYFFRRPALMVAGAVAPPRLDLANKDLIRAHVYAIWLAETGLSLGESLRDLLDLAGEPPSLALLESVEAAVNDPAPRRRAQQRAEHVLASLQELHEADWYDADWLPTNLQRVASEFDRTCERWRDLYRAALEQAANQDRIIRDASRSSGDKRQAERLRREAEEQLKLLTDSRTISQSDFYSYRYFASEGFLPGYSFPRLPLSAYIQARRRQQRDDFLSRPRFLAISEFGPRAIVYHEGSRYIINRVILPVGGDSENPLTRQAKLCPACGYLHPTQDDSGPDTCERCHAKLDAALRSLFRLQNVSTKRRDRISSDEEERMRMGYDLLTGVRFHEQNGDPVYRTAKIKEADTTELARLFYGQAATLWRMNLGWMRRSNPNDYGFTLDVERGYWMRNEQQDDDPEDPLSPRTMKVIPYVEDRRNCLLLEPAAGLSDGMPGAALDMATLVSVQAALKHAIQVVYQLEDNELAVELLPNRNDPRLLLFYESAEGGAGVLRRLVDDPKAFAEIAGEALHICHFDPKTGVDKKRAPRANEDCEAACYDCLMTYANQRDHDILDRHLAHDLLLRFSRAHLSAAPVAETRTTHLGGLLHQAESELERQWLRTLDERSYRLPSHAQYRVPECGTRPDFYYEQQGAAIYIDGPHHDYPDRQARDVAQATCMEDEYGIVVIRFGHQDDWQQIIARYPSIFGSGV